MFEIKQHWPWLAALALAVGGAAFGIGKGKADPVAVDPRLQKAGKEAAITVYPARVAGTTIAQVGEVVAMLLEQRGMANLETTTTVFTPPEAADLAGAAKAFADHVRANPPATEFALFTDFQGSKEQGFLEVRSMIVHRNGDVMWTDRQAKGDKDFDRAKIREPLQCCLLVADRLQPVLGLTSPSKSAPPGRIAQRWQKATGLPDKAELDRMQQRTAAFKKSAASSSMLVYPVHAGDGYNSASASSIAKLVNEAKLTKATAAEAGPQLKITGDINEQKVLWSMARAFSDHVKQNPPSADYVMFADYIMGKDQVGGVHIAICNRAGELVMLDMQNSHHADFKAINPKSREDCDRLVGKRLQGLLH